MKNTLHRFAGIAVGVVAVSVGLAWYGLGAIAQTCINPNPVPQGYAAPCPVLSAVANAGTLAVTVTPPGGISFTLNKIYVSETVNDCSGKVSSWCPYMLPGPYAYTDWKTAPSSLSLNIAQMNLSAGMHYIVAWNWTWDAAANGGRGCYKGPGLNTCDTGAWHIQPFDAGGSSNTIPPGTAPMIMLDLTVNGDGAQSTISAAAAPLEGFYSAPALDSGEYEAKLLDAAGETVFVHAFNVANSVIGENFDDAGNIVPTIITQTTAREGVVLPAISGAVTLEITDGAGASIISRQVADVIDVSHRQFAARHGHRYDGEYASEPNWLSRVAQNFSSANAFAADGLLRIAVLGVNYPSPAEFNTDWMAFRDKLLSTDPFSRVAGSIQIEPIGQFGVTELGCYEMKNGRGVVTCGYSCDNSSVKDKFSRRGKYDVSLTFVRSSYSNGCSWFDTSITGYEKTLNEMTLGVGGYGYVTTKGGDLVNTAWVGVHEFSHVFASLIDEYDNQDTMFHSGRNCEQSQVCPAWKNATYNIAECIPGCGGMLTKYRSSETSIMRSRSDSQFNAFSKALVLKRFAKVGVGQSPVADTEGPTVRISNIVTNSVIRGNRVLWAVAMDNIGVTRVEFYRDDNVLLGTGVKQSDPKTFRLVWNTAAGTPDGLHELFARAYDVAGNRGESQILKVVIANNASKPILKSDSESYKVTSNFTLSIAANAALAGQSVKFRWVKGNVSWTPQWGVGCTQYGGYTWCDPGGQNQPVIGANGTWTASGTYDTSLIGDWKEQALIGGNIVSNEISFSIANPAGAPNGDGPCAEADGLQVICMQQGGTYTVNSSLSYGSGFPGGSPAMGLGSVMGVGGAKIGYIPMSFPFSCTATAGSLGSSVSNTAGGKICEVIFNNASPGTGSGSYTITADANAPAGDYLFGFGANSGTTVQTPDFYIRIQ